LKSCFVSGSLSLKFSLLYYTASWHKQNFIMSTCLATFSVVSWLKYGSNWPVGTFVDMLVIKVMSRQCVVE